jgi:hypothetical protein
VNPPRISRLSKFKGANIVSQSASFPIIANCTTTCEGSSQRSSISVVGSAANTRCVNRRAIVIAMSTVESVASITGDVMKGEEEC